MPAGNPFAPLIETGVSASAGPVAASGNVRLGADENHAAAGWLLLGLVILIVLHRARFRFSQTVG